MIHIQISILIFSLFMISVGSKENRWCVWWSWKRLFKRWSFCRVNRLSVRHSQSPISRWASAQWEEWPWNRREEYWAIRSSAHSFAISALLASLARFAALIRSLARSLTPELMGKSFVFMNWMRRFHKVSTHCALYQSQYQCERSPMNITIWFLSAQVPSWCATFISHTIEATGSFSKIWTSISKVEKK